MKLYLLTRSTKKDYGFKGQRPQCNWWESYRHLFSNSSLALLARRNLKSWHLYLGGIPSIRRDYTGTPITCFLVAEGRPENSIRNRALLVYLETLLVTGLEQAGRELDILFPGDFVDSLDSVDGEQPSGNANTVADTDGAGALNIGIPGLSGRSVKQIRASRRVHSRFAMLLHNQEAERVKNIGKRFAQDRKAGASHAPGHHTCYALTENSRPLLSTHLRHIVLDHSGFPMLLAASGINIEESHARRIWDKEPETPCILFVAADSVQSGSEELYSQEIYLQLHEVAMHSFRSESGGTEIGKKIVKFCGRKFKEAQHHATMMLRFLYRLY